MSLEERDLIFSTAMMAAEEVEKLLENMVLEEEIIRMRKASEKEKGDA